MNKKILLLSLPFLLSSCSGVDTSQITIIAPVGAPTLALYDTIINGQTTTNSNANNVGMQLQADNYNGVVFDFYNGLRMLKKNSGHYKLTKLITGGNVYLVGIDKTESTKEPSEGDKIVSFGQESSIANLVLKELYGSKTSNIEYVTSNSDIVPIFKTGMYHAETVDYVVFAEPALTTQLNSGTLTKTYTTVSLREKWGEVKNTDPFIPQAGLFINDNYYNGHENESKEFVKKISSNIDLSIKEPNKIKEIMDNSYDSQTQTSLFGYNSNQMVAVQENRNGFGMVSSEYKFDLNHFFSLLNISEDYSNYINLL